MIVFDIIEERTIVRTVEWRLCYEIARLHH